MLHHSITCYTINILRISLLNHIFYMFLTCMPIFIPITIRSINSYLMHYFKLQKLKFSICLDPRSRFHVHVFSFFFFFFTRFLHFETIIIVHALFMEPTITLFRKKNIKNGLHGTIYIFKNYFVTVFSVFNFIKNKLYPNGPLNN